MNREERAVRIAELERWIADQNAEFADDAFPEEVRIQWDQNNTELDEHRRVMAELEARDGRVRRLADRPEHREPGVDHGPARSGGAGAGPTIISRMSEADVYDLNAVRTNPFQPDQSRREMRDRARRAVDLAVFPESPVGTVLPGARPADRAARQQYVSGLIERDDEAQSITRRVLLTGSPAYKRAFAKTMSAGMRGNAQPNLSQDEQRAMDLVRALSVGTGSAGGFAVPYMLDPTVIPTSNLSVNPFRA